MKKYIIDMEDTSMTSEAVAIYGSQPLQYFQMVADSGLSLEELAKIFHVTSRTLRRIEPGDVLSMDISEKVLQLRRLFNVGQYVFGERELFVTWLSKPLMALEGDTPLSYLDSSFGIDIILDLLGRIEHGIYA